MLSARVSATISSSEALSLCRISVAVGSFRRMLLLSRCVLRFHSLSTFLSPTLPPSLRALSATSFPFSLYISFSLYIYISLSLSLSFSPVNDTEFRPKGSTAALFPEQGASSILIVLRSRVRSVLCRSKGETQNLSRMRIACACGMKRAILSLLASSTLEAQTYNDAREKSGEIFVR